MKNKISRRKAIQSGLLASLSVAGAHALTPGSPRGQQNKMEPTKSGLPFRISLNCSTLMAYQLGVDVQIDKIAAAGFDGVELWMRDIVAYLDNGGSAAALKQKLQDGGLVLENIIGFSQWCNDDPEERKKAIDQLRGEMRIIADLGGKYIAAPVMGLESLDRTKLDEYAGRYKAILQLGDETGVVPVIELWGMGVLNKVADCAHIVISSGHPSATMLLDFYHVYRGGNSWDTIHSLNGKQLPVIHMNDYPATPAYDKLTDADRVLPGEGICPYHEILPQLYDAGFRGALSVELFNKGYWENMDADTMLKSSYDTTFKVISNSLRNKA